jgi:Rps23 Pro-64 3,4-dihydroxylase Tpa1-like proline 4-hydroxylase
MDPQPPHAPLREDPVLPSTPKDPQPPHAKVGTTVVSEARVTVVERPALLPAKCVVLDEFLAPEEVEELVRFTLEHERDFSFSEVVSPEAESGVINYEHRRSRVLMDPASQQDVILRRVKTVLPQVLQRLGMEAFSIAGMEAQITASNDGDFFRCHSDNGSERVASRYLTFVYFFHREPRQFEGGELRIHDARLEGGGYVSEGTYQTIVPQQNQIVFFPCALMHEITPVKCSSHLFADSRFTLNGWLRR